MLPESCPLRLAFRSAAFSLSYEAPRCSWRTSAEAPEARGGEGLGEEFRAEALPARYRALLSPLPLPIAYIETCTTVYCSVTRKSAVRTIDNAI